LTVFSADRTNLLDVYPKARPAKVNLRAFSTDDVHPRDRFAYWSDAVCASFVRLDCDRNGERATPFYGSIHTSAVDQINLSKVVAAAQLVTRSPAQIARSSDTDLLVSVQVEGNGSVEQDGRIAALQPGDFALYDSTRPYKLRFAGAFQQVVLQMPRAKLIDRIGVTETITAVRVSGQSGLGRIISPVLGGLASELAELEDPVAGRLCDNVLDFLALGLLSQRPPESAGRSLSCINILTRAKAYIAEHHVRPELSPADIASGIGVSVRYLNRILATEDSSLTFYLREYRLGRCQRDLQNPALSRIPIGNIAYAAGFNDLAHFSRLFRARYGMSPREARRAATRDV
jgi:AraC-like DNA-binding protein